MTLILDPDDPAGWREAPTAPSATASSRLTDGLNPEQREAVEYRGQALLIVAGAGSGKTSVLTRRIASLIAEPRGVAEPDPRDHVHEQGRGRDARARRRRCSARARSGMWISTFHSACVRILRREAEAIGLTSTFTIYDSADQRAILKRIIKELDADTWASRPRAPQAKISKLKNELADVESYARNGEHRATRKRSCSSRSSGSTRAGCATRTRSTSTTSSPRRSTSSARSPRSRRSTSGGSATSSSTSTRTPTTRSTRSSASSPSRCRPTACVEMEQHGVNVAALTDAAGGIPGRQPHRRRRLRPVDLRVPRRRHPQHRASSSATSRARRSSCSSRTTARPRTSSSRRTRSSRNNFDRKDKKLWTDDRRRREDHRLHRLHRARRGAVRRRRDRGAAPRRRRLPRHRRVLPHQLADACAGGDLHPLGAARTGSSGGTKFYERAEIKDAMAYLIAVANPLDELALRRIMNTPKRGIGPATETALASFAEQNALTFREAMRARRRRSASGRRSRRRSRRSPRCSTRRPPCSCHRRRASPPAPTRVRRRSPTCSSSCSSAPGYIDALRSSRDPQDEARAENVEELVAADPRVRPRQPGGHAASTSSREVVARRRRRRARRRVGHGLAHDPAHREGARVRRRVPHRRRGGAAAAPDVGGRAGRPRRGAAAVLRRHHARPQAPVPLARDEPRPVRRGRRSRCRAGTCRRSPTELIDWRQSPGMATRAAARSRVRSTPGAATARAAAAPGARATATSSGSASRRAPRPRPSGRTGSPARCATTATSRSRPATASATSTSARGGSTRSPARAPSASPTCAFDTAGQKKLLIKIAPIEKL